MTSRRWLPATSLGAALFSVFLTSGAPSAQQQLLHLNR